MKVRALVGAQGTALNLQVIKSSGVRELDVAAMRGLAKCKYKPATKDGVPIQAWRELHYEWKNE